LIFAGVVGSQPPKVDRIFVKILVKYLKRSPPNAATPPNLVHMLLCRQMSSVSNELITVTLCAEGAELQPPKHECCFCEKSANSSPPPLIHLQCPYEKFASDQIFSLRHPLSDGGESMQISAPYPEIGAPKVGKMWGLVQTAYA